ncbi:MAG: hypothetical protein ACOZCL_01385 [Bacillota bacterium]
MSLKTVKCTGKIPVCLITECGPKDEYLKLECIKVKKVFDEFALRDCVEGAKFELCREPKGGEVEPVLILKNCTLCDVEIKDISTNCEKKLRFSGKACCEVFGKDKKGDIIRMRLIDLPCSDNLSIGPDGELCFNFSVRREYPDATDANFENLVHFLDEDRFELQAFLEAVIDEDNNETSNECLVTSLGVFLAIKFDAEVQLCVPVLGYCEIDEVLPIEDNFCERFLETVEIPSFNPAQLDKAISPYKDKV